MSVGHTAEEGRSPRTPAWDARPRLLRHRVAFQGIAFSQLFQMRIPVLAPRAAGAKSDADQTSVEEGWQSSPVLWPGESQGQRSLAGCSSWGRKESDTTE